MMMMLALCSTDAVDDDDDAGAMMKLVSQKRCSFNSTTEHTTQPSPAAAERETVRRTR